jgi:hypothetical protein
MIAGKNCHHRPFDAGLSAALPQGQPLNDLFEPAKRPWRLRKALIARSHRLSRP